jgi:ATP-binding cassette, subfamily B, bacterial
MAHTTEVNIGKALRKFFKLLAIDKKDVSAIYILAILAGLVQLSLPLGIQTIISFVMAGSISTSIVVLIIMVLVGTFLNGLLQIRQMQTIEKVQQKIFVRYSLAYADRLPKLDIEKLDNYYLPELVNRFFDTSSLQKGVDKLLLDIPTAVIQIVFGITLLAFYHPAFIAFGFILIFIIYLILKFTSPKGFATNLEASDYKYSIGGWFEEMARSIRSFKYSRGSSIHIKKTDKLITGYLNSRTTHFKVLLTQYWSLIAFKILITAAMLIVGAILLVDQQINVGQFVAADIVIITIIASIEKLVGNIDKVYDTLTSIEKLNKVIEKDVEKEGSLTLDSHSKGLKIEFRDVTFNYLNGSSALINNSFIIPSGSTVCISGPSGSGKSSILRLLTSAYNDYTGSILINNVPINNYQLQSLRSQTGILLSQQDIFNGTLLENITMGDATISMDTIATLVRQTGLEPFLNSLKEGYDTILDSQGKHLPKYVRQNILLLRAIVGRHKLLLLEEPFDHLNEEQTAGIIAYLQHDKFATTIITTEKSKYVKESSILIELDNGKIKNIVNR